MAQTSAQHGMNIEDQKETFHGFLAATIWLCAHIAQYVLLLTLAFAIGLGWWAGLAGFFAVGVVAGLLFRMSGVWWAAQVVQWLLLGLGGLVVPMLAGG
jgi:hypothetical protein